MMLGSILGAVLVPASVAAGVGAAAHAMEGGLDPAVVVFRISLASLAWVAVWERLLPHRRAWNRSHGDIRVDALYYVTQIVVGALLTPAIATLTVLLGAWLSARTGGEHWPHDWPLLPQVLLATAVREFLDYWAHRSMHRYEWLWRMHATHHTVPRMYWLNATRAHPGKIAYRFCLVWLLPLSVLGVGETVLALTTVAAVVADAFQHANIAIRLGPLSWIYSIGDLHRWHHSRERREADTNYGNVYIFWDAVFGTRYLPADREPPEDVGVAGLEAFPRGFLAQCLSPLSPRWARICRESERRMAPTWSPGSPSGAAGTPPS